MLLYHFSLLTLNSAITQPCVMLWDIYCKANNGLFSCISFSVTQYYSNTVFCRKRANNILQRSSSCQMQTNSGQESWLPCKQQFRSFGKHHCSMRFPSIVVFNKAQPFSLHSGLDMITKPWTCCQQQQFRSSVKHHCSIAAALPCFVKGLISF